MGTVLPLTSTTEDLGWGLKTHLSNDISEKLNSNEHGPNRSGYSGRLGERHRNSGYAGGAAQDFRLPCATDTSWRMMWAIVGQSPRTLLGLRTPGTHFEMPPS